MHSSHNQNGFASIQKKNNVEMIAIVFRLIFNVVEVETDGMMSIIKNCMVHEMHIINTPSLIIV